MNFSVFLNRFFGLQYPIFMIAAFLLAFLYGRTVSSLISLFTFYWLFYSIYVYFNKDINSNLKTWMILLISYFLLSCVGYAYNGMPLTAYYMDIRTFLCPMLLVFAGSINCERKVYYWFVIAVAFCMLVGLYLYTAQPNWYLTFKVNALSDVWYVEKNLTVENIMELGLTSRFSSFFSNIYPVSYFGVFAYCILINDLYKEKRVRLIKSRIIQIILLLVVIIGVMYTMVRVATLYIVVISLIYIIYGFKTKNSSSRIVLFSLVFIIGTLVAFIVMVEGANGGSEIIERVFERLGAVSYDDMMSGSRAEQNVKVLTAWQNYLLGDGMGSRGGYARSLGLPGITDGGWTKFLVEFGIVGLVIFLLFIFATFRRAFKSLRYYLVELSIFCYGLIAMVGADTLAKGWMVTIMWISVGRIWNDHYLKGKIKTVDRI